MAAGGATTINDSKTAVLTARDGLARNFLTEEELVLKKALEELKRTVNRRRLPQARALWRATGVPPRARRYLERMNLKPPRTLKEHVLQRVVIYALASVDAI